MKPQPTSPARLSAPVSEWDRQKGYGFLGSGRDRIFLHRRDFLGSSRDLAVGEIIHFIPGRDAMNRRCATQAVAAAGSGRAGVGGLVKLALLLVVPLTAGWVYGFDTAAWGAFFLGLNWVTYRIYAADKRQAQAGQWRIPEVRLHLLEAAGGWPAAFLAQRRFRHKCSKQSYQVAFWLIVLTYQWVSFDSLHRWKYSSIAWHKLPAFITEAVGTGEGPRVGRDRGLVPNAPQSPRPPGPGREGEGRDRVPVAPRSGGA